MTDGVSDPTGVSEAAERPGAWLGRTLEVTLDRPAHGGFCVARHDGRVVFVRQGLPGERVRVRVEADDKPSWCRAEVIEVLDPSPHRRPSVCAASAHSGSGCCDLAHVDRAGALAYKTAVLREQLERIGGPTVADIGEVPVEALPAAPEATAPDLGWRTRVRLTADADGRFGYHRYRSEDVVADLRCPQPVAGLIDGVADLRAAPGSELLLMRDADGSRHVVEIGPPAPAARSRSGSRRERATGRRARGGARRTSTVLEGDPTVVERVGSHVWRLEPSGFWQAHIAAPRVYSDVVTEWADPEAGDIVWDLYSGAGLFAAPLADRVGPTGGVDAVEIAPAAIAAGRRSLADLPAVRFHRGETVRTLASLRPDPRVIVLDPPRAGAGRAVVAAASAAEPARIVHIGCDPASFARDLALYGEHGYRPRAMRAFDAFPLTHHVEAIALLTRED